MEGSYPNESTRPGFAAARAGSGRATPSPSSAPPASPARRGLCGSGRLEAGLGFEMFARALHPFQEGAPVAHEIVAAPRRHGSQIEEVERGRERFAEDESPRGDPVVRPV